MFDLFTVFWFCLLSALLGGIAYAGIKKGKKEKKPSQLADEIKNPDEYWLETKKEVEKDLIQSLLPSDESLLHLQEGLSRKENMLVRGENTRIICVKTSLNHVSVSLYRDFMGIYRIKLGIDIDCWEDEVYRMTENKTGMYGFASSSRSRYGYYSHTDNHKTLLRGWMMWLSEKLSEDCNFKILYSPWDIFRDRNKRDDEIIFCSAEAYVNKFSVKGKPSDVYQQLLSFTEEMKNQLEKEYIDSIGFFSRKISDYISETILKNITIKELKGESIIDLRQSQLFVIQAILELDKNDFVLKLRLEKPEVVFDPEVLLGHVEDNLLNFFSDYGKPVEIINESQTLEVAVWNGKTEGGESPSDVKAVFDTEYSFTLRVKEIGEDLHS